MQTSCCSNSASVSPWNLVTAATTMTTKATVSTTKTSQEKESTTMMMLCVVFIVLFYGSVFLFCFVMYPKLPKEATGDEEAGDPLPAAEKFGKDGVKTRRTEMCVICLEEFKKRDVVRVLVRCKHVFHVGCIDSWCLYRLACPICRAPFRLFEAW